MQRPGRSGGSGNDSGEGNMSSGGFPDPFAGLFGGSMMQEFFGGRDPFDQPFFNRSFSLFPGAIPFSGGIFAPPSEGSLLEQRPQREGGRRGPIIEEVDEGHHDTNSRSQEPIVEHPDDDVRPDNSRQSRVVRRNPGAGRYQSYSFQSSSFSTGGPNGAFYTSSTARQAGPNGVAHEEHYENDSTAGTELHRVSKGIYDKGHSVTRKRNAEGREENQEAYHNLEEDEAPEFEKRWESEAGRNLSGWNRSRGGNNGAASRQRALPHAGSSGWSGARDA